MIVVLARQVLSDLFFMSSTNTLNITFELGWFSSWQTSYFFKLARLSNPLQLALTFSQSACKCQEVHCHPSPPLRHRLSPCTLLQTACGASESQTICKAHWALNRPQLNKTHCNEDPTGTRHCRNTPGNTHCY